MKSGGRPRPPGAGLEAGVMRVGSEDALGALEQIPGAGRLARRGQGGNVSCPLNGGSSGKDTPPFVLPLPPPSLLSLPLSLSFSLLPPPSLSSSRSLFPPFSLPPLLPPLSPPFLPPLPLLPLSSSPSLSPPLFSPPPSPPSPSPLLPPFPAWQDGQAHLSPVRAGVACPDTHPRRPLHPRSRPNGAMTEASQRLNHPH